MKNIESIECSYTIFSGGDHHFYKAVTIPLATILNDKLKSDASISFTNDLPKYLSIDSRPIADASLLIGGIVGIFTFFASKLANKVFDDIYKVKFQPAIMKALGVADNKLSGANAKKSKMLQFGISYEDKQVLILIGILEDSFDDILKIDHIISTTHSNAVKWIDNNSYNGAVHLYVINGGQISLEPKLFDNLTLANEHIKTLTRNQNKIYRDRDAHH